ncbi:hypothetical protein GCM10009657_03970 [Oryzihumus leptocrescens]|nr:globin domain-containing protein [Oryzihumus leptocrescens]
MDTQRLKSTWRAVTQHGDDVALYFYAHLFVSHPELREMFPLAMEAQRDRLVGALGRVVSNVDELGEIVPYVEQLGRDHRRFGVIAEHYDAVGGSLLWTLKHFLGEEWTADVARDWADAYGVVAAAMVAAAEESEDTQPAWWDAEITEVARVSREIAVVRVLPDSPVPYRPGQSMAVTIPHAPRCGGTSPPRTPLAPTVGSSSTSAWSRAVWSAPPSSRRPDAATSCGSVHLSEPPSPSTRWRTRTS